MSTEVCKFKVPSMGLFEIQMPVGAIILTVGVQSSRPFIWVEVNPDNSLEDRMFRFVGLGDDMPTGEDRAFVGMCMYHGIGGEVSGHLFEVRS